VTTSANGVFAVQFVHLNAFGPQTTFDKIRFGWLNDNIVEGKSKENIL
jgi:hypothetical protein